MTLNKAKTTNLACSPRFQVAIPAVDEKLTGGTMPLLFRSPLNHRTYIVGVGLQQSETDKCPNQSGYNEPIAQCPYCVEEAQGGAKMGGKMGTIDRQKQQDHDAPQSGGYLRLHIVILHVFSFFLPLLLFPFLHTTKVPGAFEVSVQM
ncbi:hypothetical protein VTK56DRAFT_8667 [Thermocarpiscus australiensis]